MENIMSELILEPRHTAVVVIDLQKGIMGMPGNPHSASSVTANCVASCSPPPGAWERSPYWCTWARRRMAETR